MPSCFPLAFEVTTSLSTPGLQPTAPRTFPDVLEQGDSFRHHPSPKIKFGGRIRSGISLLGLSHLFLEDLHGLGKGFWYRPLMVAQDGHGPVRSVVGQELSCNVVFSWKEMKKHHSDSIPGVGKSREYSRRKDKQVAVTFSLQGEQ